MVRGARWRKKGRWFDSRPRHKLSFWNFRIRNIVHISAKTIQMKSSMTFIQSNGCTGIYLILKQIWRRFKWWQVSFNLDLNLRFSVSKEQKIDLTQSYDKTLTLTENSKKAKWQHKNFDYTTITDRLRTLIWSTTSTILVWLNRWDPNLPTDRKRCVIKRTHFKHLYRMLLIKTEDK